ncbi:hypothetical protein LT493_13330 [Streptomyces tricolor]|nr:hypothetical protein [Streptomyces tricolor]
MAWRDRLRRRAAGPSADGRSGEARSGEGRSGHGPDPSASGAPLPSVPGDWDGGWRRTAPPELTVSRAPLGVSDGLAFRAGLAAWQNPSFDSGLGHAVLPTAPTGLVRGVTRPAGPQTAPVSGGPLLLRALRPEEADGPGGGTPDAGGGAGRTTRPSGRVPNGSTSSGSTSSGSGPSGSGPSGSGPSESAPAVVPLPGDARAAVTSRPPSPRPCLLLVPAVQRAAEPGAGPVVAPADTGDRPTAPRIPLVRRVAVIPGAVADRAGGRARFRRGPPRAAVRWARAGCRAGVPVTGRHRGACAGPAHRAGPRRRRVRPGRPAPPGGPLPTVARRPLGPVRRVLALRPATEASTAAPTGTTARSTAPAPTGTTATRSTAPAPAAATRAPLGAPLTELPSTATPPAQGTPAPPAAPGPALPVVQSRADGPAGTPGPDDGGARERPTAPRPAPPPAPGPARAAAWARRCPSCRRAPPRPARTCSVLRYDRTGAPEPSRTARRGRVRRDGRSRGRVLRCWGRVRCSGAWPPGPLVRVGRGRVP